MLFRSAREQICFQIVKLYNENEYLYDSGILTENEKKFFRSVDMDMVSEGFVGTLMKSIKEGKVRMGTLNTACRRILEAKYKLGLFDNPYKYCDVNRPKRDIFTKEHRDAARRIAAESFVLLKNDAGVLPLKKQGTVAVIGPLGNTRSNMPITEIGRAHV